MTYSKLPGVYFTETINSVSLTSTKTPLFIVQTSTAIADIDNKLIKFGNYALFEEVATGKGLTNTLAFIEEALNEAGMINNAFYVYSVKTDTAAAFSNILVESSNYSDIKDVVYFEETKSANANTINSKLGALKTGANTCYQNGVNRVCYCVPYGTVTDDVEDASGTDEEACITSLTTAVNGITSGRVAVIVPDYAGAVIGRVLAADYNEEIGYDNILTAISNPAFQFNYSQMLTLQNMGIMFIRGERLRGNWVYRVNLGVSTAFSGNGADGLLLSRRVCDEVLEQVKYACDLFVKSRNDVEGGLVALQTDVDTILDRFISAREIDEEDSELYVDEGSDVYTFNVSGTIKPIKSTIAINVNTTLA